MSRDHRQLKVFRMADELVLPIYMLVRCLPGEEKYGLSSQLRRACVSVPTNIVEGCSRRTERELAHFGRIALGSAMEVGYLLTVVRRLEFPTTMPHLPDLVSRYDALTRALYTFVHIIEVPKDT